MIIVWWVFYLNGPLPCRQRWWSDVEKGRLAVGRVGIDDHYNSIKLDEASQMFASLTVGTSSHFCQHHERDFWSTTLAAFSHNWANIHADNLAFRVLCSNIFQVELFLHFAFLLRLKAVWYARVHFKWPNEIRTITKTLLVANKTDCAAPCWFHRWLEFQRWLEPWWRIDQSRNRRRLRLK